MAEPGPRRGRTHNAEGAQEAILNAAEGVFAQEGFDGARIDAIAAAAGYNKSLIFHYFDDKLGLYTAVMKRIEAAGSERQARMLALADETTAHDAHKFRAFVEAIIRYMFDTFIEHPRLLRIVAWEEAGGWQTLKKIVSQFDRTDEYQIQDVLRQAQQAGLLRSDIDPLLAYNFVFTLCLSYLTYIPLYELTTNNEVDFTSSQALKHAREMMVKFVIHAIMADSQETEP